MMSYLKHFIVYLAVELFSLNSLIAQNKDAAIVYADFSRYSSELAASNVNSSEYQRAKVALLQLFPQLQYHAAVFSQLGNKNEAMMFAKAYVDMATLPQFEEMHLDRSTDYVSMTYFLASQYYNQKDYANAVPYLERYLAVAEPGNRASIFLFLAKSYESLHQNEHQIRVLKSGLNEFPTDENLLAMSINVYMAMGLYYDAEQYINMALLLRPNDSKLKSLLGQSYEGQGKYLKAVEVYEMLAKRQKTLPIYKHYALNLFNYAVSLQDSNSDQTIQYLNRAIPILEQVVHNEPASVQFNTALALAYLYTDHYEDLNAVNSRLHSLDAPEVGVQDASKQMVAIGEKTKQQPALATTSAESPKISESKNRFSKTEDTFSSFAKNYIEKDILQWQQKDPYETLGEYMVRVTESNRQEKVRSLMAQAKEKYLEKYIKNVQLSDFSLQPYDAENGVFLIRSQYGDILLSIPRENNEARSFAINWNSTRVQNPRFDVSNDEVIIRAIDFVAFNGKIYHYSDKDEGIYELTEVNLQFDKIDYDDIASNTDKKSNRVEVKKKVVTVGKSDVDVNIPESNFANTNTFAFLIGNENYHQLALVPYALHDVETMATYCKKTLGIPARNVRVYKDATFGKLLSCIKDIKTIVDAFGSDINIILYYAGHGLPDEMTKSAFLLPVDGDGTQTETCYSVDRLYDELGLLQVSRVIVLMDACFSGSQRGEGMLASARGVALRTRPGVPKGNMVVISAATGNETAYPYEEKGHGLFTYFVLKHLQETKGRTTISQLCDYVKSSVQKTSILVNNKSQTPTVTPAAAVADEWGGWKLK